MPPTEDDHSWTTEFFGLTGDHARADVPASDSSMAAAGGALVQAGVSAAGELGNAIYDGYKGTGEAIAGFGAHVAAGILDGVGAHETAAEAREAGNAWQDAYKRDAREWAADLQRAKDDVLGSDDE